MDRGGLLYASAAPGKGPLVPNEYKAEWVSYPVWLHWKREKILVTAGNLNLAVWPTVRIL
jgi:hypothetical protein